MTTLQKLKNSISNSLYGMTVKDAIHSGRCIQCKEIALENCYSEAGRKEFYISGLCEKCFDEICLGLEE